MKNSIETQIRIDIKQELSKLTKSNSPYVWGLFHYKNGQLDKTAYARLEERIIRMMLAGNIPPAAVIPQLEMENETI